MRVDTSQNNQTISIGNNLPIHATHAPMVNRVPEDSLPPRVQGQLARPQIQQAPNVQPALNANPRLPGYRFSPNFTKDYYPLHPLYDLLNGKWANSDKEIPKLRYMRPITDLPLYMEQM
jgi:hypothetical protein